MRAIGELAGRTLAGAGTMVRDLHIILGDLLVRVPSASGEGRRRKVGFAIEDGHQLGGLTHFDLLNHPAVYDQIRAWVER